MIATALCTLCTQGFALHARSDRQSHCRAVLPARRRHVGVFASAGPGKTTEEAKPVDAEWVQDVVSELTDSSQFGQRGEAWFAAQVVALLLVAFPPGGLRAPVDAAGWLAVVAGLGLAVAGQQSLGVNLTPLPKPRDSSSLVTGSIYRYCRHPMYGGLLLASAGLSVALGDELRMLAALLVFLVLDRKASYEEELLEERYGEEYRQYRNDTKKLIPYIY